MQLGLIDMGNSKSLDPEVQNCKYITVTCLDIKQIFLHKTVNLFLPISFNICLGAQQNRLIETVLLSTHNICFG